MATAHDLQKVYPSNNKTTWFENDQAVFNINANPGQAIRQGTVKLVFDLELTKNGSVVSIEDPIYLPNTIGAHALVRSLETRVRGGSIGDVEHDYAFVQMAKLIAARDPDHDTQRASAALELKTADAEHTRLLACGTLHGTHGPDGFDLYPSQRKARRVIITPDFCLNNMMTQIPFSQTAQVTVGVTWAMAQQALWLPYGDPSDTYAYQITNLYLQYVREPESGHFDPRYPKLVTEKSNNTSPRFTLESQQQVFANSCSVLFYKNDNLFDITKNSYMPHWINGTREVRYGFGDSDNTVTAFALKDKDDILRRYIGSWSRKNKSTGISATTRLQSTGCGLGFKFNQPAVDLGSSTLRIRAMLEDPDGIDTPSLDNQYQSMLILHCAANLLKE